MDQKTQAQPSEQQITVQTGSWLSATGAGDDTAGHALGDGSVRFATTATLVLKDAAGGYYLLTPALLATARATDAQQAMIEEALGGEVSGFAVPGDESTAGLSVAGGMMAVPPISVAGWITTDTSEATLPYIEQDNIRR